MFRRVFWWINRPLPVPAITTKEEAIIPELPEENPEKFKPIKTDLHPTS